VVVAPAVAVSVVVELAGAAGALAAAPAVPKVAAVAVGAAEEDSGRNGMIRTGGAAT
jgi:hypothetical protein